jgi:hypothetical protein
MLIEAYKGAGRTFLASRIAMILSTDTQIERHSAPAVRSHYAGELQLMLDDDGFQELCLEMADKALLLMRPDREGESL